MSMRIISLNLGQPQKMVYKGKEYRSGITKLPSSEPQFLTATGFIGDGQADVKHHGGKDKAVCVYCAEHYPYWRQELGKPLPYPAFGENVTVLGLLEEQVCIGDKYLMGEAVVQVSQPRQPCHTLVVKHGVSDLVARVVERGFTGYYFSVLKEGLVPPSASLELIERHPLGLTVQFANRIHYYGKDNKEGIKQLLQVEALSGSWREDLSQYL